MELDVVALVPANLIKPGVLGRNLESLSTDGSIANAVVADFPTCWSLREYEKVDCEHWAVWGIPVMQPHQNLAWRTWVDLRRCRRGSLDKRLVIVPDGDEEKAARPQFCSHCAKHPRHIVFGEEVRDRVVTGDHHVERAFHRP